MFCLSRRYGSSLEVRTVDERLQAVLEEGREFRDTGTVKDSQHPEFLTWKARVQSALDDKLGPKSRFATEFHGLMFFSVGGIFSPDVPRDNDDALAFNGDLNSALSIIQAAIEAEPAEPSGRMEKPSVSIQNIGGIATSESAAAAQVDVHVTVEQLRSAVASAQGLSPEEHSGAMLAIPDDPADLDLDKAEKLLSLATKAQSLFQPILGWLLTHGHHLWT